MVWFCYFVKVWIAIFHVWDSIFYFYYVVILCYPISPLYFGSRHRVKRRDRLLTGVG